jgi:hypothetical protein
MGIVIGRSQCAYLRQRREDGDAYAPNCTTSQNRRVFAVSMQVQCNTGATDHPTVSPSPSEMRCILPPFLCPQTLLPFQSRHPQQLLISSFLTLMATSAIPAHCHPEIRTFYGAVRLSVKLRSPHNRPRRPRGGEEVELYSFFNLGIKWEGSQGHTPRPLYPRGKSRYPLYRRLGEPQGRSGRVRKISLYVRARPARSVSLYRLSYRGPLDCR